MVYVDYYCYYSTYIIFILKYKKGKGEIMSVSLREWLIELSDNYSVQQFDDIESGTFVAKVKKDVYLMNHVELKA